MNIKKQNMKNIFAIIALVAIFMASCIKDEPFVLPEDPNPGDTTTVTVKVVINELMTKNEVDPYYTDPSGAGCDWAEFYNTGDEAIDIGGMFLSDKGKDAEAGDIYQISDTHSAITTIQPNGYLVIIFGAADANGGDMDGIIDGRVFIPTGLSSTKDVALAFFDKENTLIDESPEFAGLEVETSMGRENDGADNWINFVVPTPGVANSNAALPAKVLINELMTKVLTESHAYFTEVSGDYADWVEIVNTGGTDLNLAGYYFSDKGVDATADDMFLVPDTDAAATTVAAGGRLMVVFGAADELGNDIDGIFDGILFIPTGLKASKDVAVAIFENDQATLLTVSESFNVDGPFGELEDDKSLGRVDDGSDDWQIFDIPTPNEANSIIAPDPANVLINELMTKVLTESHAYFTEESGDFADWVEIVNTGGTDLDLAGYYFSDKGVDAPLDDMFLVPDTDAAATTVTAGGRLMVVFGAADAEGNDIDGIFDGILFIPTGLKASKDVAVAIFANDQTTLLTVSEDFSADGPFGELEDDKSMGRTTDGADDWMIFNIPTPNAENEIIAPTPANVLVNELMTKVLTEDYAYFIEVSGDFADWVEIINTGGTDLDLAGYYFSDKGVDATVDDMFLIPDTDASATTVPANGRLMVVFGAADADGNDIDGIFDGILFIPTGLKASKDVAVAIFGSDQTTVLTVSEDFSADGPFGELEDDKSLGRVSDGDDAWQIFDVPTPDASNN